MLASLSLWACCLSTPTADALHSGPARPRVVGPSSVWVTMVDERKVVLAIAWGFDRLLEGGRANLCSAPSVHVVSEPLRPREGRQTWSYGSEVVISKDFPVSGRFLLPRQRQAASCASVERSEGGGIGSRSGAGRLSAATPEQMIRTTRLVMSLGAGAPLGSGS
eukprot:11920801-Alexandrium_andersonii.AAC.1